MKLNEWYGNILTVGIAVAMVANTAALAPATAPSVQPTNKSYKL